MVLPAMVYKSDPGEAVAHFRAVAAATDLPLMLYNNPVGYPVDITPELFADLADEPNLVAIKEIGRSAADHRDPAGVGDRFALFCGVDDLVLEPASWGSTAGWPVPVNAFPRENQHCSGT